MVILYNQIPYQFVFLFRVLIILLFSMLVLSANASSKPLETDFVIEWRVYVEQLTERAAKVRPKKLYKDNEYSLAAELVITPKKTKQHRIFFLVEEVDKFKKWLIDKVNSDEHGHLNLKPTLELSDQFYKPNDGQIIPGTTNFWVARDITIDLDRLRRKLSSKKADNEKKIVLGKVNYPVVPKKDMRPPSVYLILWDQFPYRPDYRINESYFNLPLTSSGIKYDAIAEHGFIEDVNITKHFPQDYLASKLRDWKTVQKRPTWNNWLQRDNKIVEEVNFDKTVHHDLILDISLYNYNSLLDKRIASQGTDQRFVKFLDEHKNENNTELKVRFFSIDGLIELSNGEANTKPMEVKIDSLKHSDQLDQLNDFQKRKISLKELSDQISAGQVSFKFEPKDTGCATVILSIWDRNGTVPLDYLIKQIPISSGSKKTRNCGTSKTGSNILNGGLVSLLDSTIQRDSLQRSSPVSAALHIFEFNKRSIAVFAEPAVNSRSSPEVYAWEMKSNISDYMQSSSGINLLIKDARTKIRNNADVADDAYMNVANELADTIFSGKRLSAIDHNQAAKKALAALKRIVETSERPVIFTKLENKNGELVLLPLRLLSAPGKRRVLEKDIIVVQPLPRQNYANTCIKSWTFAIPDYESISGVKEEIIEQAEIDVKPAWISKWLHNFTDYKNYFDEYNESVPNHGTGLLLLSHHDEGYLWLDNKKPAERLLIENMNRKYSPGSVGILSACSTTGIDKQSRRLLEHLNRQNLDAMIVSPFNVDADYGTNLTVSFSKVLLEKMNREKSFNMLDLFDAAVAHTANRQTISNRNHLFSLEFIVAGDYGLTLCAE